MTTASSLLPSQHGQPPESLLTLSSYFELALDEGECVVLTRHGADVCAVYIGDPKGGRTIWLATKRLLRRWPMRFSS